MAAIRYNKLHPWKGRGSNVVSLLSWPYVQRETTTGGNVTYEGKHSNVKATDDDTGWVITKFITFDTNNICTKEKTLIGSWTGRDGLDW